MRSKQEIIADPTASAEEIMSLTQEEQIMHPNCPAVLWWARTSMHLDLAVVSPLFDLLTLEDPEQWERLFRQCRENWIAHELTRMHDGLYPWQFVTEKLREILPLYEEREPNNPRMRQCLEARERFQEARLPRLDDPKRYLQTENALRRVRQVCLQLRHDARKAINAYQEGDDIRTLVVPHVILAMTADRAPDALYECAEARAAALCVDFNDNYARYIAESNRQLMQWFHFKHTLRGLDHAEL